MPIAATRSGCAPAFSITARIAPRALAMPDRGRLRTSRAVGDSTPPFDGMEELYAREIKKRGLGDRGSGVNAEQISRHELGPVGIQLRMPEGK
jgi:hypothetical protein